MALAQEIQPVFEALSFLVQLEVIEGDPDPGEGFLRLGGREGDRGGGQLDGAEGGGAAGAEAAVDKRCCGCLGDAVLGQLGGGGRTDDGAFGGELDFGGGDPVGGRDGGIELGARASG